MDTVGEYITHTSTQLNDQRFGRTFTRWGRGLLLAYLNLGLSEIATYRPEAFATEKKVTLQPGSVQSIDKGTITSVVSNIGGPPVSEGDFDLANAFMAYDICPPKVQFKNGNPIFYVRSYSVDKSDPTKFYVAPPVPSGVKVDVLLNLMQGPTEYTLEDWDESLDMDNKYANNLIDFMCAKAYEVDMESAQSRHNSDSMYHRFYTSMGIKYKRESSYRAGNYLADDKSAGGN